MADGLKTPRSGTKRPPNGGWGAQESVDALESLLTWAKEAHFPFHRVKLGDLEVELAGWPPDPQVAVQAPGGVEGDGFGEPPAEVAYHSSG